MKRRASLARYGYGYPCYLLQVGSIDPRQRIYSSSRHALSGGSQSSRAALCVGRRLRLLVRAPPVARVASPSSRAVLSSLLWLLVFLSRAPRFGGRGVVSPRLREQDERRVGGAPNSRATAPSPFSHRTSTAARATAATAATRARAAATTTRTAARASTRPSSTGTSTRSPARRACRARPSSSCRSASRATRSSSARPGSRSTRTTSQRRRGGCALLVVWASRTSRATAKRVWRHESGGRL